MRGGRRRGVCERGKSVGETNAPIRLSGEAEWHVKVIARRNACAFVDERECRDQSVLLLPKLSSLPPYARPPLLPPSFLPSLPAFNQLWPSPTRTSRCASQCAPSATCEIARTPHRPPLVRPPTFSIASSVPNGPTPTSTALSPLRLTAHGSYVLQPSSRHPRCPSRPAHRPHRSRPHR